MPSPRKGAARKRRQESGRPSRGGRKPLGTSQAGQRRLPSVRRRSQQSRAKRLAASLQGTGGALVSRAGRASSKGRSKPGLVLVASAGAAAIAMRMRRNTQAALEPLLTENEAPASEAHEAPPASPPAAPATPAGESRAPTTEG